MNSTTIAMSLVVALSPVTAMGQIDRYEALADLPFNADYPTPATSRTLEEELFFQRAVQTYLWALPAVNMFAMKEGQAKTFGEGYNVLAIFEKRLKPNTLLAERYVYPIKAVIV